MLREVACTPVRITGVEALGGPWAPVERVCLDGVCPGIGASVVVKTRRHQETGWGGDPANLRTERRSLTYLRTAGLDVAPEVLAFDEQVGVLVMRDLAPARSVEWMLFHANEDLATSALVALDARVASMHAATGSIGPDVWNAAASFMNGLDGPWEILATGAQTLGFPDASVATPDVARVAEALSDPRWRTFTHGDLTPANALLSDGCARLIDFEGAGPRHAFLDAANLVLPFPAYGYWADLPRTVVTSMEAAYRGELVKGLPLAADDLAYGRAMATGAAAWAILRLSRLGLIATGNQNRDEAVRRRSQIVQTVESCVRIAERTHAFPALMGWLTSMVGEMRRRWPEANVTPRRYPAFGSEPWTKAPDVPATPGSLDRPERGHCFRGARRRRGSAACSPLRYQAPCTSL
jgi:hypothetical protein